MQRACYPCNFAIAHDVLLDVRVLAALPSSSAATHVAHRVPPAILYDQKFIALPSQLRTLPPRSRSGQEPPVSDLLASERGQRRRGGGLELALKLGTHLYMRRWQQDFCLRPKVAWSPTRMYSFIQYQLDSECVVSGKAVLQAYHTGPVTVVIRTR